MRVQARLYTALVVIAIALGILGTYLLLGSNLNSAGLGACSWSTFILYNVVDDVLSDRPAPIKKQRRELMFAFGRIGDVSIDFWDKFRLTSKLLPARYGTFFKFSKIAMKNCLNVVFIVSICVGLPAYTLGDTKVMGAHVLLWLEVPLVFAYIIAWLFTLSLLCLHQSRYIAQEQTSSMCARSWEAANIVRVCSEWFCWIGRFSAINLLRTVRLSEPLLHLKAMSKIQRLHALVQVIFNCIFGFMALRYKVELVEFAATKNYYDFSFYEWFLLLGFVNNLFSLFDLDAILISAKIQAQQISEKEWLTELAQELSGQQRPLGSFVRMVALRPLDVDVLMCELCKLECAFDEGRPSPDQIVCVAWQDRIDPGVVPPLFSVVRELIEAHKGIRAQARVMDHMENTSFGSGGAFIR